MTEMIISVGSDPMSSNPTLRRYCVTTRGPWGRQQRHWYYSPAVVRFLIERHNGPVRLKVLASARARGLQ
jgi:hypothetical protein